MRNGRNVTKRTAYKTSCLYHPRFSSRSVPVRVPIRERHPPGIVAFSCHSVRSLLPSPTSHCEYLGRTYTTPHRRTARFRSTLGKHSDDVTPTSEFDVILSVFTPGPAISDQTLCVSISRSTRLHNSRLPIANGTRRVDSALAMCRVAPQSNSG